MLLKVAEKKVNKVLAMKVEADRMAVAASDEMKKVTGELYAVADGMRAQAHELDSVADSLVRKFEG